jgi:hypothetical protein
MKSGNLPVAAKQRKAPRFYSLGAFGCVTLALHYIDGLQAFLTLGDFEFDLVPFMKNLETVLFNG